MKEEKKLIINGLDVKPNLHQLVAVLNMPYARIATKDVAFKPIEGEVYEKGKVNWESVEAFIERRLDKTDYDNLPDLYDAALKVEYVSKPRRVKGPNSWDGQMLFGTTPTRKGHLTEGDLIFDRKSKEYGEVQYVNDTILVYRIVTFENNLVSYNDAQLQTPSIAIGNRVFNQRFDIVEPEVSEPAE